MPLCACWEELTGLRDILLSENGGTGQVVLALAPGGMGVPLLGAQVSVGETWLVRA